MKKQILNLGRTLTKLELKNLTGGRRCDDYYGPTYYDENMCEAFDALPFKHQICAMVSVECYPR